MAKAKSRGNGDGTIYFSESKGRWVAQYTIGKKEDGNLKRKTLYGKTRKEVKAKLDQLILEYNTDKIVDKSSITMKEIAYEIVEDKRKLNQIGSSTYIRHIETIKRMSDHYIMDMPIQSVKIADIKDFLASTTNYSNSVISKNYGMLKAVYRRAIQKDIVQKNIVSENDSLIRPKSKKATKKISAFTVAEQKELTNILTNRQSKYGVQILLSMYAGMRMGEINALTLKDIDFDRKIIHVDKTLTKDDKDKTVVGDSTKTYAGIRDVPMNPFVVNLLKRYLADKNLKDADLLFLSERSALVSTAQINSMFKRLCEKHNVNKGWDVNQHMLRHTFATRCIESGMPATVLQKILGHTDITTTLNTYCDIFAEYERKNVDRSYEYLIKEGILG